MANIPISSFTAAANTTGIGMSGFSLTGSNAQSIIDLAATWNTSGTPTGIKLNVTDTASNAASLLMNLQVGGVSQFSVRKDSTLIVSSSVWDVFANAGATNVIRASANGIFAPSGGFSAGSTRSIGFSSGTAGAVADDTTLFRDAANTLAQRSGVNNQTLRVYETFTDASNYSRMELGFDAGNAAFMLRSTSAGTGTLRPIVFMTSGNVRWSIGASTGNFLAGVDNTYDIGSSGALRPRYLYLGGGSLTGTQADSSLTISPTWNTTGTPTAMLLNVTDTASNAASLLMDLQVGGASRFRVNKAGAVTSTSGATFSSNVTITSGNMLVQSDAGSYYLGLTNDLILARDAANTLAQRNGVNSQVARFYNTYTDASNYERGKFSWSSNVLQIGTEKAGTGTARALDFQTDGATRFSVTSNLNEIIFNGEGRVSRQSGFGGIFFDSGNNITIGAGGTAAIFGGYIQASEMTAPAAPATNNVRIYAEDNGSGKTRLMARFATGAAVQIAIEP